MTNSVGTVYFSIGLLFLACTSLVTSCVRSKPFSIKGIIQQIEPGKDGYTASLRDEQGKEFDALVSRVRMQQSYRLLRVGEKVRLVGDTIHLDGRVRVLVNQIH
ncbi:hypothetical protein [Spirosoma koreense]